MITIELIGSDTATSGAFTVTHARKGPIGPLCRKLIASGCDPTRLVSVVRGGMTVFHPARLSAWAERDTYDHDQRGLITRRWRPFEGLEGKAHAVLADAAEGAHRVAP
jgi:hypothetical protein